MADHYFSSDPQAPETPGTVTMDLGGREVSLATSGGVFSHDRLDLGTRVLLRTVPDPPAAGDLLDLGCGWGPLALTMAAAAPRARVWAVDVNPRALELTRRNAAAAGLTGVRAVAPDEVPDDVTFAAVWSNPPIRIGKPQLHTLLLRWLPRLAPGGAAYLVVQRNLGADSLHAWLRGALSREPAGPGEQGSRFEVDRLASAKGYRVLRAVHGRPTTP